MELPVDVATHFFACGAERMFDSPYASHEINVRPVV
jgi:hypothetical protein